MKVGFSAWEATWRWILMIDQLKKRVCIMSNRCYMCKSSGRIGLSFATSLPKQISCGSWYSLYLMWLGWCTSPQEEICWIDMDLLWERNERKLQWSLFGHCGRKKVGGLLKIWNSTNKQLNHLFWVLFSNGSKHT